MGSVGGGEPAKLPQSRVRTQKPSTEKTASPLPLYWGWLCSATGWGAGRPWLPPRGSPFSEAPPGEGGCEACSRKPCELQRETLLVILTEAPWDGQNVSKLETFARLCPGGRRTNSNRFCCS